MGSSHRSRCGTGLPAQNEGTGSSRLQGVKRRLPRGRARGQRGARSPAKVWCAGPRGRGRAPVRALNRPSTLGKALGSGSADPHGEARAAGDGAGRPQRPGGLWAAANLPARGHDTREDRPWGEKESTKWAEGHGTWPNRPIVTGLTNRFQGISRLSVSHRPSDVNQPHLNKFGARNGN